MVRAMRLHRCFAALALVLGCSSETPAPGPVDSAVDAGEDVPTVIDVGVDRPDVPRVDAGGAALFSPCTNVAGCRNIPSAQCIAVADGYPNGHCTRSCSTDAQCGTEGICLAFGSGRVCFQRCVNGRDCRAGYQCFLARGEGDDGERACFPFCTDDAQCPGRACNRYSRFCGTLDTTRGDNDDPCANDVACRSGRCFEEFNTTTEEPSGYLGGQCYSRCTVPAASEYAGPTYPRGDCPEGSVCVRESGQSAGDTALCRGGCRSNDDCRGGYICLRSTRPGGDAGTYENGYCAPMNCHFMTQTCPAGATCRTTRSNDAGMPTSGFCVRPPDFDGGTPTDAPATDAVVTDAPATDAAATDAGATDAPATDATATDAGVADGG